MAAPALFLGIGESPCSCVVTFCPRDGAGQGPFHSEKGNYDILLSLQWGNSSNQYSNNNAPDIHMSPCRTRATGAIFT
jgi:hypothetical protein